MLSVTNCVILFFHPLLWWLHCFSDFCLTGFALRASSLHAIHLNSLFPSWLLLLLSVYHTFAAIATRYMAFLMKLSTGFSCEGSKVRWHICKNWSAGIGIWAVIILQNTHTKRSKEVCSFICWYKWKRWRKRGIYHVIF